jgi:polysaccharide pyruvyl transferase WcaK-like protein
MSKRNAITLLGNNSGRNLGDAAILAACFSAFSKHLPDVRFYVPSVVPDFIDRNYASQYNAKGINCLPWTLSARLFGLPTILCLMKSRIACICDGIIFGRKLLSVHNFLWTLVLLVPFAKLFRCKLICLHTGIGPFPSRLSKKLAAWLMNCCDLLVMRDEDSLHLAREIGVNKPIELAGDMAFLNQVSSRERATQILIDLGITPDSQILGLNVTSYFDSWLPTDKRISSADSFLNSMAEGINDAVSKITSSSPTGTKIDKIIFSCSPMDEEVTAKLAAKVGAKVVANSKYLSHDIQAVMRECGILVGMRFHSIVLSSAVGVPVVGLILIALIRQRTYCTL